MIALHEAGCKFKRILIALYGFQIDFAIELVLLNTNIY